MADFNFDGMVTDHLGNEQPMSIVDACAVALYTPSKKESSVSDVIRRRRLVDKIAKGGTVSLTPEDIVLLKACAAAVLPPLPASHVILLVDPDAE